MYLFGHPFSFYLAYIPDTVYSWRKSYVLQAIICFASFHLFLTWIKVVNPFGVICYFVLLLLSIYVKTYEWIILPQSDITVCFAAGVSDKEVLERKPWKPVEDILLFLKNKAA